jgi:hypothetical protein
MNTEYILSKTSITEIIEITRDIIRDVIREELKNSKLAELSEKLLTPKETAAMFSVSTVTLWKWEKLGYVKKYHIGGKTFFKYAELIQSTKYIKSQA